MQDFLEFLRETWWSYETNRGWYSEPYHWVNLLEGCAWLIFAFLVVRRYVRFRKSMLELLYALAFFTFGLSDFWEAYALQPWLILFKGLNVVALLYLRWLVISRFYPQAKTY